MNNKKSNVNTNSTKLLKGDFLRKIKPDDKFPCFMCFDHPRDKIACKECSGKGWILGSHPMVQFAQDYIEKRMGMNQSGLQLNNSSHNSDFGQIASKMSRSYDPRIKSKSPNNFDIESSKTIQYIDEVRSSRNEQQEQLRQTNSQAQINEPQYFCNECPHQNPIKGKRFHCQECQDYDLCECCYINGYHKEHKMQQIDPIGRPNKQLIERQIRDMNLRKSIKNYK